MWSLGALLFGHLTRNCRCSHCPGINSNYALYSDGFCASDPQPPRRRPSVPPPLTHTHRQSPNTHFPLFSAPSHPVLSLPLRYWWTHLATGALWSHYEWTYRNMHIQARKRRRRKKEMHIPEVFLERYLSSNSSAHHILWTSSPQSKMHDSYHMIRCTFTAPQDRTLQLSC